MFTNTLTMALLADQAFPVAKALERVLPLTVSERVIYRSGEGRVHVREFDLLQLKGDTALIRGVLDGSADVVALHVQRDQVVRAGDLVQAIGNLQHELEHAAGARADRKITWH